MSDLHLSYPLLIAIGIFPVNKLWNLGLNETNIYNNLTAWSFVMLVWYIINIMIQITDYLDIYWWRITPNSKKYN